MELKEFIEGLGVQTMMKRDILSKLIELESLNLYFRTMLGVELEITVKPAEVPEGRFLGKGVADLLK
jgi:hypothetical protein